MMKLQPSLIRVKKLSVSTNIFIKNSFFIFVLVAVIGLCLFIV